MDFDVKIIRFGGTYYLYVKIKDGSGKILHKFYIYSFKSSEDFFKGRLTKNKVISYFSKVEGVLHKLFMEKGIKGVKGYLKNNLLSLDDLIVYAKSEGDVKFLKYLIDLKSRLTLYVKSGHVSSLGDSYSAEFSGNLFNLFKRGRSYVFRVDGNVVNVEESFGSSYSFVYFMGLFERYFFVSRESEVRKVLDKVVGYLKKGEIEEANVYFFKYFRPLEMLVMVTMN